MIIFQSGALFLFVGIEKTFSRLSETDFIRLTEIQTLTSERLICLTCRGLHQPMCQIQIEIAKIIAQTRHCPGTGPSPRKNLKYIQSNSANDKTKLGKRKVN